MCVTYPSLALVVYLRMRGSEAAHAMDTLSRLPRSVQRMKYNPNRMRFLHWKSIEWTPPA